ncbi:PREDICTED: uncharacterized protein LOC109243002 [Nicotiana attenuata]|uniref:uncharacterized protein LOC109243002 n=1 Tax=Nicotiana attenuata TaxID=49451 RepID=UPI000904AF0F|nr:PREDICTED: uncharacterized protein LOC109243002 [Nicotiana attenuata]
MIISGGDDTIINHVKFTTTHKLKWSIAHEQYDDLEDSIVFNKSDADGLSFPHYDALVINLRITDSDVKRIMVDDGSDACIIHPWVLVQMRLEDKIIPRCITLRGFNNTVERTSGEIVLPVLAGGVTLETTFHVMNQETAYNAIIGLPWIHAMRAVPSSFYQTIKFPTPWGIFSIRGEPRTAQECYCIAQDCAHTQQLKGATYEATVEDLDPVQLDSNNSTKKAYIGHNLPEPDMPGILRDVATHKLNVDPLYTPVRQMRRKFNAATNDAVSKEVDKLLANGFIRESKYPQWVANVVMVKTKNGKWRMCVDFTDLNKTCPKDSFPLPHIDQLIDAIARHEF